MPTTDRPGATRDERKRREAAALRENLRRRKAQARAREDTPDGEPTAAPLAPEPPPR